MLVNDILNKISKEEGVSTYTQITLDRYVEYQKASIKNHIDFNEDKDFEEFYIFLNSIFSSRVNRPTAVKILNNAYYFI
ncbi:hypothetical protein KPL26_13385 [Clostridium algidicarnis]|uniref:hypothetical protein n=1 Tax=Clostridium algidicarnis TaxID=37659 RepID=UPI001C0C6219|nr:hypothetical protein [Clostridium algidicarnis]MBU3197631.1 hypothetical protein [Clostridium algidicarnis]